MKTKAILLLVLMILSIVPLSVIANDNEKLVKTEFNEINKELNKVNVRIKEVNNERFEKKLKEKRVLIDKIKDKSVVTRMNNVRVALMPKVQRAQAEESVEYKITVQDMHLVKLVCKTTDCVSPSFNYNLDVKAINGVRLQLEKNEIRLGPGEKTTVLLKVSAKKQGLNAFIVTVKGEDVKSHIKGALVIVDDDVSIPFEKNYFSGKGFAINEEENKGKIISLTLLKSKQELVGKINIGTTTFKTKGTVENGEVNLKLLSLNGEREATLIGKVDKFDNFLLFRGDLKTEDTTYEVSLISSQRRAIHDIRRGRVQKTVVGDVLTIEEKEKSTYINPKRIERKKFLNLFSYGKKRLILDIVSDGEVKEAIIEENSEVNIGDSTIVIGNLDDDIEITVN